MEWAERHGRKNIDLTASTTFSSQLEVINYFVSSQGHKYTSVDLPSYITLGLLCVSRRAATDPSIVKMMLQCSVCFLTFSLFNMHVIVTIISKVLIDYISLELYIATVI